MTKQGLNAGKKTVGLSAYALVATGLVLILLSVIGVHSWSWSDWVAAFVRDIGLLLAAVMAGSLLHEKLLRDETVILVADELERQLTAKIPTAEEIATATSQQTHSLFCASPPSMTGIQFTSKVRRNFGGYYSWVHDKRPQELVFAGRSVLHRINADLLENDKATAEAILFRKLKEGSKIRILFLDPRTDLLDRLAREEHQTPNEMLGDIATSVGICRRLFALVKDDSTDLPPSSELMIHVYDRVPYFAYHRQDDEIIVGFYFMSGPGYSSPAYTLVDEETKRAFAGHFDLIANDPVRSTLLEFDGARRRPTFNTSLFESLRSHLAQRLTEEEAEGFLSIKGK